MSPLLCAPRLSLLEPFPLCRAAELLANHTRVACWRKWFPVKYRQDRASVIEISCVCWKSPSVDACGHV